MIRYKIVLILIATTRQDILSTLRFLSYGLFESVSLFIIPIRTMFTPTFAAITTF